MSGLTEPTATSTVRLSRLNRVGLVLAGLLASLDVGSLLFPPEAGQTGPPRSIWILDAVLGVVTLVAIVWAWRARVPRAAQRIVVAARTASAITALPALFVDVPTALKLLVGVFVLLTVVTVVLVLIPSRPRSRT